MLLTNGLGFSPDGRHLYHSDSRSGLVRVYDVAADGSVGPWRALAQVDAVPDGLAVAADGSVWVALAEGGAVLVLGPDGVERRRLPVPLPMVTSVCFGGDDLRDLYVVTGSRGGPSDRCGTVYSHPRRRPRPPAPARARRLHPERTLGDTVMIKSVVFFKRKTGIPVEEFQAYWRERSIPRWSCGCRGCGGTCSRTPGSPATGRASRSTTASPRSGSTIARRCMPSGGTDELAAVEGRRARLHGLRDEARDSSPDEHVIKDEPVPPGAFQECRVRHPQAGPRTVDEFRRYWREVHGPLAAQDPR